MKTSDFIILKLFLSAILFQCVNGVYAQMSFETDDTSNQEYDYLHPLDMYWEPGAETTSPGIDLSPWYDNMCFYMISESENHDVVFGAYLYFNEEQKYGATYFGEINIPDVVEKYYTSNVVGITDFFRNGVTILRLPKTIECIDNTIEECGLLREVYLNDNLETLTGIRNCPNLRICPLPSSLKTVGDESMSRIMIEEIILPQSLTTIGNGSFSFNYNLKTLELGSVEFVGEKSFSVLPLVQRLSLPETLLSIGADSFSFLFSLERLYLPSHSISGIEECFKQCNNLKELIVNAVEPYPFPTCFRGFAKGLGKKIYVPDESLDLYQTADTWKNLEIRPMSELDKDGVAETRQAPQWNVRTAKGTLIVDNGSDRQVDIHNLAGVRVKTVSRHSNAEVIVAPGIYTVSCADESLKVIVE